jgi:L-asparaginase II
MADLVPLVETTRGSTRECVHFGAIAVADATGRVLAHAGDPHWVTFTRSTLKPLQALPFVQGGGVQRFGLTPANLALLCASHNGEPMHVEQVEDILGKAGVGYKRLQCGCHPAKAGELGPPPPADLQVDERNHNCSGKHSGFLAWCVQHDAPLETYLDPAHRCSEPSASTWRKRSACSSSNWQWESTVVLRRTTRCRWQTWRAALRGSLPARGMRSSAKASRPWHTP